MILQEHRASHRLLLVLEDRLQVAGGLVAVRMIHAPRLTKPGVLLNELPVEPGGDRTLFDDLLLVVSPRCLVEDVVDLPLSRLAGRIDQRLGKTVHSPHILVRQFLLAVRSDDLQLVVAVDVDSTVAGTRCRQHELDMDHRVAEVNRRDHVIGVVPRLGRDQLTLLDRPVDLLASLGQELRLRPATKQHGCPRGHLRRQLVLFRLERRTGRNDLPPPRIGQPQFRGVADSSGQVEGRLGLLGPLVTLFGLISQLLRRIGLRLGLTGQLLSRRQLLTGHLQSSSRLIRRLLRLDLQLVGGIELLLGVIRDRLGRILGLLQLAQLRSQIVVELLGRGQLLPGLHQQPAGHLDQGTDPLPSQRTVRDHAQLGVGRLQIGDPADTGSRLIEIQTTQSLNRLQLQQTGVGDRGAKQVERLEMRQLGETLQARVGDPGFGEIEVFQGRDARQVRQARVGHRHPLQQHRHHLAHRTDVLQVIVRDTLDGKPQVNHHDLALGGQVLNAAAQLLDPRNCLLGSLHRRVGRRPRNRLLVSLGSPHRPITEHSDRTNQNHRRGHRSPHRSNNSSRGLHQDLPLF